jgi:hypothetical protein
MFEWGKALLEHCLHEQFFFDDDPYNRIIGFVCSCAGNDQKWTISLSDLKKCPIELNNVLLMLKARAKDPNSPWHLVQQLKAAVGIEDTKERHKRFMRNQRISAVILAIEQLLAIKRISPSKRKRLQRRRARLRHELA